MWKSLKEWWIRIGQEPVDSEGRPLGPRLDTGKMGTRPTGKVAPYPPRPTPPLPSKDERDAAGGDSRPRARPRRVVARRLRPTASRS